MKTIARPAKTYGFTLDEIDGIARLITLLDDLTDRSDRETKSAIDRAHATIERVLGPDAGHIYAQEVAA